ncbi:hypothetical protein [Pasteurella sp. PK-2025]|uniref:hypothetical protein n=1 Tax=Pasteurella sp. PK-2025 TaxID=3413133 RepID=UPI003C7868BA
MKSIINLSITTLLSLGIVACGSNGGTPSTTQQLPKDHIDYIDLNPQSSGAITLTDKVEQKEEGKSTVLSAVKQGNMVFLLGHPKDGVAHTPSSYKDQLVKLDAKYQGSLLVALNEDKGDIKVEKRKVVFNLKQDKISGHSVKSKTADDVQVIFKEAKVEGIKQNDTDYLGFIGNAEVMKDQKLFSGATYFGSFAGSTGEEISGGFVDKPETLETTQPKVSGGFIATREVKAESTATPKQ